MAQHSSKTTDYPLKLPVTPDHVPGSRADTSLNSTGRRRSSDTPDQGNPPQPELDRPLTIAEVARHYRMSERTVRRRLKDGTLQNELGGGRLVRIGLEQIRRLSANRQ